MTQGILAIFPLSLCLAVLLVLMVLVNKRIASAFGASSSLRSTLFTLSFAVLVLGIIISFIAGNYVVFSFALLFSLLLQLASWLLVKKELSQVDVNNGTQNDANGANAQTTQDASLIEENAQNDLILQKTNAIVESGYQFMTQASDAFKEKDGVNRLLSSAMDDVIKSVNADGGVILLVGEYGDVLEVKTLVGSFPPPYQLPQDLPHRVARVEANFRFAQFALNETIFGACATSGKAELINEPLLDERIVMNEPEDFLQASAYMFIPLMIKSTVIGVLALARSKDGKKFTEEEFATAQQLSQLAAASIHSIFACQEIAERAEAAHELELACELQKNIHPKKNCALPGLTVGSFFNGAEGVCGDYYDIIPCRKERISFVLADIAGKGMNSLIVMVMIRAILQLIVNTPKSAGTILSWTNRGITGKINIDHFASIALVNFNSLTNEVEFSVAGSAPVLVYRKDKNEVEEFFNSCEPIGVDKNITYKDMTFNVQSGDIIVLYTDGVVEAINQKGQQYGITQIKNLVVENAKLKAQDISNKIKADLKMFCDSVRQHDDQTVMVIKIN